MVKRDGRKTALLSAEEFADLISDEPYSDLLDLPENLEDRIKLHETNHNSKS